MTISVPEIVGGIIGAPIGLWAGLKIRRMMSRFDLWLWRKLGILPPPPSEQE